MEYDIYDNKKLWMVAYDSLVGDGAVKQAEICKATGLSASYVSNSLGSKTRPISDQAMGLVSDFFGKTVEQMIEIGKRIAIPKTSKEAAYPIWADEQLEDMPADELYNEADKYTQAVTLKFNEYAAMFSMRVKALVRERNRLLATNEEMSSWLENSPGCISVYSPQGDRVYSNREHRASFGEKNLVDIQGVIESGGVLIDIIRHDGEWYGVRAWPTFDKRGRVLKVITVLRDITAEYEEAIKR